MNESNVTRLRSRLIYSLLLLVVIAIGLFSRSSHGYLLTDFGATYAGDTLWSLALYLFLAIIFPKARIWKLTASCLLLAYAVEFFQLYQANWINSIRATLPGKLILGSGFLPSDFVCYTVGCLMGMLCDFIYIGQTE